MVTGRRRFLIADNFILTAYHAAFSTLMSRPSKKQVSLFTLTEVKDSEGKPPSTLATPVDWGDYNHSNFTDDTDDWALLAIQEPLGKKYHWLWIDPLDGDAVDDMDTRLTSVGYGADKIQ